MFIATAGRELLSCTHFPVTVLWAAFVLLQSKPKSPETAVTCHDAPILHMFDQWLFWSPQQSTKRARQKKRLVRGPSVFSGHTTPKSHEHGFQKLPDAFALPGNLVRPRSRPQLQGSCSSSCKHGSPQHEKLDPLPTRKWTHWGLSPGPAAC